MFRKKNLPHRSGFVVVVIRDQNFPFLCGIASIVFLGNKMAHKTTHGLSSSEKEFTAIVDDHKKNARVEKTYGKGSKNFGFGLIEL